MNTLVVDASVAAKWLIPEPGSPHANALFSEDIALLAPDLLWIEVAQIGWKHVRRGLLKAADVEEIVVRMTTVPVERCSSSDLLPVAARLAIDYDRTVYDALYLALALREDCQVVTADARLVNALSRTAMAERLRLLGGSP